MMFIPVSKGFAETETIENYRMLEYGTDFTVTVDKVSPNASPLEYMFDGDETTAYYMNYSAKATITFSEEVDIRLFRLKASTFNVTYNDIDGKYIDSHNTSASVGKLTSFNISQDKVKSMVLNNTNGNPQNEYEFQIFVIEHVEFIADEVNYLTGNSTYTDVKLTWQKPTNLALSGYEIYQGTEKIAEYGSVNTLTHSIYELNPNTSYEFTVKAKYDNGKISEGSKVTVMTGEGKPDTTPPGDISNLVLIPEYTDVTLIYDLPTDEDFNGVTIYRDGVVLVENLKESSYIDSTVVEGRLYTYRIVATDLLGNRSNGVTQNVRTEIKPDETPPEVIEDINPTVGNGNIRLTWEESTDENLLGYNVYVNGVKHNKEIIKGNSYTVKDLENGKEYTFTVTAVDKAGNESESSKVVTTSPDRDAMPIINVETDLEDVSMGVGAWFGSTWQILAFSVGILLAFMIAHRVKYLFTS